jgi:hypothetical protein
VHVCFQLSVANALAVISTPADTTQLAALPVESRVQAPENFNFIKNDINNAQSLDPFTHIYMFDIGMTLDLHQNIAVKFNASICAVYLICFKPPMFIIDDSGFDVELIGQLNSNSMYGKY